MYLLDADTIIYNLKGNEKVQQALRLHLHDPFNGKPSIASKGRS
jgi:hypothetical protein